MIAATILAAIVGLQPPGESAWIVVSVSRVIAPDQHPGECFVQARIEQVVRGQGFRAGDAIGISLACSGGGAERVALAREPLNIRTLKSQKRALVHVDAGGRVLENAWYGLGAVGPATPT